MAETLGLTTPIAKPSITTYRVIRLELSTGQGGTSPFITVDLLGSDGSRYTVGWTDAVALSLISALNTANLSVKSLQRRILERVAQDYPALAGNVSGTPD